MSTYYLRLSFNYNEVVIILHRDMVVQRGNQQFWVTLPSCDWCTVA